METNDIVREVAAEMLNTSMQDITAECINGWATRLGEVVVAKETTTPTCQESRQVQTMDEWAYPLTNVCKCGNGQEPKTCATVKDANGVVLLHFNGIPWRSNKDSTAMATEFCERMNAQGKVGNAAAMREALERIIKQVDEVDKCVNVDISYLKAFTNHIQQTAMLALSAPARNCDKYSHDEALRIWSSLPETKENGCFDVWLYAEAKGETK